MVELVTQILLYVARGICQALKLPEDHGAKALIYAAFDTGVAPQVLSGYLTERGQRFGEASADIAEEAKLAVQEVERGIAKDQEQFDDDLTDMDEP
jgi:hypothetical protein